MQREPLSDHFPDIRKDPELREMVDQIDQLFDVVLTGTDAASIAQAVERLKDTQTQFIQTMFRRARTDRAAFEALLADDVDSRSSVSDLVDTGNPRDEDDIIIDLDVPADDPDEDDGDHAYAVGTHLDDIREVALDYDLMVLAPRNASVSRLARQMGSFGFRSVKIVPLSVWAYTHKLRVPLAELTKESIVIHTPGAPTRSLAMFEAKAASRRTMPLILVRCESLSTESVATDLRVALGMVSSPVVQRSPEVIQAIQTGGSWGPNSRDTSRVPDPHRSHTR